MRYFNIRETTYCMSQVVYMINNCCCSKFDFKDVCWCVFKENGFVPSCKCAFKSCSVGYLNFVVVVVVGDWLPFGFNWQIQELQLLALLWFHFHSHRIPLGADSELLLLLVFNTFLQFCLFLKLNDSNNVSDVTQSVLMTFFDPDVSKCTMMQKFFWVCNLVFA